MIFCFYREIGADLVDAYAETGFYIDLPLYVMESWGVFTNGALI